MTRRLAIASRVPGVAKCGTGCRRVLLLPATLEALRALRERQTPTDGLDLVFRRKGRPYHRGGVWASLHRSLAACGLPPMPVHALRRTYATLHLRAGTDVRTPADLLGHSNPSETMRTYAHVVDPLRWDAAARLGRLLEGSEEGS